MENFDAILADPEAKSEKKVITDIKQLRASEYLEQTIEFLEKEYGMKFIKKSKDQYKTICPFHSEGVPSLHSYLDDKGLVTFRCFGACGRSYDVFDIIKKKEEEKNEKRLEFWQISQKFANFLKVEMRLKRRVKTSKEEAPLPQVVQSYRKELSDKHYEALDFVADYCHALLIDSMDPHSPNFEKYRYVFRYLAKRGVTVEDVKRYKIGFCPPSRDPDYFEGRAVVMGFEERYGNFNILTELGLAKRSIYKFQGQIFDYTAFELGAVGRYWDTMRGRLVFPIIMNGRIESVINRLPRQTNKEPKWCWSYLAPKTRLFYGWDQAVYNMKKYKMAIIVEGIFDYFALSRAVGDNSNNIILCTFGAHFTQMHAQQLEELGVEHYIFAYDSDEAGKNGLDKAVGLVKGNVFQITIPKHDPADSFTEGVPFLQGLTGIKGDLDRRTTRKVPPVLQIFARNRLFEIVPAYALAERKQEHKAETAIAETRYYHYSIEKAMELVKYGRTNKNGKEKKDQALIEFLKTPIQEETNITFRIPAWYIDDGRYFKLGDNLRVFIYLWIKQQRMGRYITQTDQKLAYELGMTRQVFNKHKRNLESQGYIYFLNNRKKYSLRCIPTLSKTTVGITSKSDCKSLLTE